MTSPGDRWGLLLPMATPKGLSEAEYREIVSDAAADAHNANFTYFGSGLLVFVVLLLILMPTRKVG